MDRRSWLWRRKSSDKSPGETESSGSVSSHSERFFDDQAYATQTTPSPEVMSKAASNEEATEVKILTEKLSAALLKISAKEDLVQQHAKVAEEAISGWEKAENDLLSFKQQLDAAKQKNSDLEDRVSQLDRALKECTRQLRQAREEQEQKIHEAVANNSHVWESKKSELEWKVIDLEAQLQTAKAEAASSIRADLRQKLEAMEKENSGLKLELLSRLEELEFMIFERDISTQAAEAVSKQHLETIMKVAKLEAECQRLKAVARKTCSNNDRRSFTASSVYVESFTDSLSENGERLQAVESVMNECEPSRSDSWASASIAELDRFKNEKAVGKNRTTPSTEINLMDDFLEMERLAALPDTESRSSFLEAAPTSDKPDGDQNTLKAEVEALIQKNSQLEEKLEKIEANRLEVEMELAECQKKLHASQSQTKDAELKVAELQTQLVLANKSNQEAYEELEATKTKKAVAESKIRVLQTEVQELISKIGSLVKDIRKEQALSTEYEARCGKLEEELSRTKHDAQLNREAEILHKELISKIGSLEEEIQKERALSIEYEDKCGELEAELSRMKHDAQLKREAEILDKELISKIGSLEEEIQKERSLSIEYEDKCGKLEEELSRMKHDAQLQREAAEILHREGVNCELKLKQEKELSLAASRFAECQKTIASLGQQLKSLTTTEDFLLDTQPKELHASEVTHSPQSGGQPLKLHRSNLNFQKRDPESSILRNPCITSEKSRNGFGKAFPRSKSVSRAARR